MRLDHTYLIVNDFNKSVALYSSIFQRAPDYIEEGEWADWHKDAAYFGLMNKEKWTGKGGPEKTGRSPVLVFTSDNLDHDLSMIQDLNLTIHTQITKVDNSNCNYSFFEFKDPDGHVIEVAHYTRKQHHL